MWKLQPTSESLKHHHHHHHPLFNFCSGERRPSDCGAAQTYASSRWCPTQEQLRALEEFYKRGIRTPSTYQIQQITAQLRRFGKIEGKNVFYWFQNHKARERQRIRRRLSLGSSVLLSEGKSSKDVQVVQYKSSATNATLQESISVSIERADTTGGEKDGWKQQQQLLVDRQIQQISSLQNNNNNGISPSRQSHVTIHSTSTSINEDRYSCIDCQFEAPKISTRRPNKTLELFPLHCDEKANDDPVQFYEFL